jgi:hypothetical protein
MSQNTIATRSQFLAESRLITTLGMPVDTTLQRRADTNDAGKSSAAEFVAFEEEIGRSRILDFERCAFVACGSFQSSD